MAGGLGRERGTPFDEKFFKDASAKKGGGAVGSVGLGKTT